MTSRRGPVWSAIFHQAPQSGRLGHQLGANSSCSRTSADAYGFPELWLSAGSGQGRQLDAQMLADVGLHLCYGSGRVDRYDDFLGPEQL
jgi:hypothetical protein